MTITLRQRRKDARPQELLDAALALFLDKGFAATRAEEVAAQAGVSKGTLYRYYPSKEELFKAVVRNCLVARIAEGADMMARHQGSAGELLTLVMGEWWRQVGLGVAGGISRVMLAEARLFPELARFYCDEVIEPTHALLGGLIERGIASGEFRPVPVPETVHVLIGPLLHLMLAEHSFGPCRLRSLKIDPAAVLATQLDLIFRGLMAKPVSVKKARTKQ